MQTGTLKTIIKKMENKQERSEKKLMLISPMLHQGGFERVCVETARIMQPLCDITIVIFSDEDIAYDISGLKVVNLGLGPRRGTPAKLINILRRKHALSKLKKELGTDIAYSFGLTAGIANCLSHGNEKVYTGLRGYTDLGSTRTMKLYAEKADGMICCSECITREIKEKYNYKNASTLYNPYDTEQIRRDSQAGTPELPFAEGTRVLVSMGREDDVKAFWFMLKAFALIHEKAADTGLMIIGEGTYEEDRELAGRLGISDSVYFAGLQTRPYEYLKCGTVYLMTSIHEGFPNAMVEAMALGLPAVSVNCMTGPAEILDDNAPYGAGKVIYGRYGIICPAVSENGMTPEQERETGIDTGTTGNEETEYADAVLRLLNDSELYAHYHEASLMRAGDFSQKAYAENLKEILFREDGALNG